MLAHEEVWDAIDDLASRNSLSPSGLARRAGLDPTTFNKSKRHAADGRPRWPSTESISKILRATNTNIADFFGRKNASVGRSDAMSIPMLGQAHAGFESVGEANGGGQESTLPMPARIVNFPDTRFERLYALSVVGDSMKPLYRNGDVLFVAPDAPCNEGDRVVVKLKDSDVVVKVLKTHEGDAFAFHAINPEHPDAAFDSGDVEWMARIVYATQ